VALSFSPSIVNHIIMPNQANKSKGQSDIVKPKKQTTMPDTQKKGTASSTKHTTQDNGKSVDSGTGKGGSKNITGGSSKA
jgi:hypothetical protein